MKSLKMKKVTALLMSLVLVFTMFTSQAVHAATQTSSGSTEEDPIILKEGTANKKGVFLTSQRYIYYKFVTTKPAKITVNISVSKIESDVSADFYYMKSGNKPLASEVLTYSTSKEKAEGKLTSEYYLPEGDYIIRLKTGGSIPDGNKVTITVNSTAVTVNDKEPENDSLMTPQKVNIVSGKTYTMMLYNLMPYGMTLSDDNDWMTFTLEKAQKVTISLKPQKGSTAKVKLYLKKAVDNGNPEVIEKWDVEEKNISETINKLEAGTYYLHVERQRGYFELTDPDQLLYQVSVLAHQKVTSVSLNYSKYTLKLGSNKSSVKLKGTAKPSNANVKTLKWSSSNTKVAKVSSTGKVTAVGKGSCTITAKATDGSGKKATCKITVK